MRHPRPRLTPYSRWHAASLGVEEGWPQAGVAELLRVSRPTVAKWVRGFRPEGLEGLQDRSCRPHRCPCRRPREIEELVVTERRRLGVGSDDLAARLGLAPVTVGRVLRRHGCSRLADDDRTHTIPVRYQRERPGQLVQIDLKKLGRVPEGGGWRLLGKGIRIGVKEYVPNPGRDCIRHRRLHPGRLR